MIIKSIAIIFICNFIKRVIFSILILPYHIQIWRIISFICNVCRNITGVNIFRAGFYLDTFKFTFLRYIIAIRCPYPIFADQAIVVIDIFI